MKLRRPLALAAAALALITLCVTAACSSAEGSYREDAACGAARDVYASIGGERVIGSYDGFVLYTVWRTPDGLVYLVRATKNGACIVHVGRELSATPL